MNANSPRYPTVMMLLALLTASQGVSRADLVTFEFAGSVIAHDDWIFPQWAPLIGDSITGSFSYERSLDLGAKTYAEYDLPTAVEATVSGHRFASSRTLLMLSDSPVDQGYDYFSVASYQLWDLSELQSGSFSIYLDFADETGALLDGTAVPQEFPASIKGRGMIALAVTGPGMSFTIDEIDLIEPRVEGDFDRNGVVDAFDIDALAVEIRRPIGNVYRPSPDFDMNGDHEADFEDLEVLVKEVLGTHFGDANLDGQFGSQDLVDVFAASEYEDQIERNSRWITGDWNADGEFDSGDLIVAFRDGGYEQFVGAGNAVPEPSSHYLMLAALVCGLRRVRVG